MRVTCYRGHFQLHFPDKNVLFITFRSTVFQANTPIPLHHLRRRKIEWVNIVTTIPKTKHNGLANGGFALVTQTPVASFTKEVNPRLAKRRLVFNGRLANRRLISLVKEATGLFFKTMSLFFAINGYRRCALITVYASTNHPDRFV